MTSKPTLAAQPLIHAAVTLITSIIIIIIIMSILLRFDVHVHFGQYLCGLPSWLNENRVIDLEHMCT